MCANFGFGAPGYWRSMIFFGLPAAALRCPRLSDGQRLRAKRRPGRFLSREILTRPRRARSSRIDRLATCPHEAPLGCLYKIAHSAIAVLNLAHPHPSAAFLMFCFCRHSPCATPKFRIGGQHALVSGGIAPQVVKDDRYKAHGQRRDKPDEVGIDRPLSHRQKQMTQIHATMPSPAPFGRPVCPICTSPMFIVTVEPDGPRHEAHTYECPHCRFVETSVVMC